MKVFIDFVGPFLGLLLLGPFFTCQGCVRVFFF